MTFSPEKQGDQTTVYIVSLGCAKNLVDTEVISGYLVTNGYLLSADADDADVMLINTCSFIKDACNEADSVIREGIEWKHDSAGRRIVVAGCLPQRCKDTIEDQYPDVDLFLGVDDVPHIAEQLGRLLSSEFPRNIVKSELPQYLYNEDSPRLQLTPSNYAYVKIAEGCDHTCHFCTIPAIRGKRRSRDPASIVKEVKMLIESGVKEINLIAQDTTAYGKDRSDDSDLAYLLKQIDKISSDFWIRVLYTHPLYFTEGLMDVFKHADHVVPYVDMPLQHVSDNVLRQMGRGRPDSRTIKKMLDDIRQKIPDATVRTTFLTGYPGETENDFEELYNFIVAFRFDRMGVFAFSPEPGTPAANMTEKFVLRQKAEERRDMLLKEQQVISLANNKELVGSSLTVLPESAHDEDTYYIGRTQSDAPEVDNTVIFQGPSDILSRGFVKVKVTSADYYDIFGTSVL